MFRGIGVAGTLLLGTEMGVDTSPLPPPMPGVPTLGDGNVASRGGREGREEEEVAVGAAVGAEVGGGGGPAISWLSSAKSDWRRRLWTESRWRELAYCEILDEAARGAAAAAGSGSERRASRACAAWRCV